MNATLALAFYRDLAAIDPMRALAFAARYGITPPQPVRYDLVDTRTGKTVGAASGALRIDASQPHPFGRTFQARPVFS